MSNQEEGWSADASGQLFKDAGALYSLECALAGTAHTDRPPTVAARVATQLRRWMRNHLSSDGLWKSSPWKTHLLLPVLARLRLALTEVGWDNTFERGFTQVVQCALQTSIRSGCVPGVDHEASDEFRRLLVQIAGEHPNRQWKVVANILCGSANNGTRTRLPDPGIQSDEVDVALLRRDWSADGASWAIDYRAPTPEIDFRACGRSIIFGAWSVQVSVGGELVPCDGRWKATCWHQDEDGEYVELQQRIGHGTTLERQVYLSRRTQMLWLTDTVKVARSAPIELTWRLPFVGVTELKGHPPTRAQSVVGFDFDLRLLPVGSPSDPLAGHDGTFLMRDGVLHLSVQANSTRRLFLPLVLLWDRDRLPPQAPWRQLTITNDRRLVKQNEAVAFRVPYRDLQVVFFRALQRVKRYAFVGHQTFYECVIGHMDADGDLSEWMMVE